jgi:alpha-tubulin suppressor-like RCC1 family protein
MISGRAACMNGGKNKTTRASSSADNPFIINAPTGLTAATILWTQIDIAWQDNSNNDDGFEIERRSPETQYAVIVTIDYNTTSYTDTGLLSNTPYYYRVRALNTIGDRSAYSNEATATTLARLWAPFSPSAGVSNIFVVASDGGLWGCGLNTYFQLGLNDIYNRLAPTPIGTDLDWLTISGGGFYSIGIKNDGTIYGWGLNDMGQLGFGDTTFDGNIPYQIGNDSDWYRISTSGYHVIASKYNGTLWGWGYNGMGQLGLGDTDNRFVPTPIEDDSDWSILAVSKGWTNAYSVAMKSNGTIWWWGFGGNYTPAQMGTQSDWSRISTGDGHNISIKTNNTLWGWGTNNAGQLGLSDNIDRNTPSQIGTSSDWIMIATGVAHTIARKTNNTIWSSGLNTFGQLGLGYITNTVFPLVQSGTDSDWLTIAAGGHHSVAIKNNGTLYGWGSNGVGQLGLGDVINRTTPTLISYGILDTPILVNAVVISQKQIDLSWIDISYNETGFGIERKNGRNGTYTQIATVGTNITNYTDITTTTFTPNTTYYYQVRGFNGFGNSAYSAVRWVAISGNWVIAAAGRNHSICLKTNGSLWSWGSNSNGQLGLGYTNDSIPVTTPTQIGVTSDWVGVSGTNLSVIAGGYSYSIALKTNRTIWSWGYNLNGELGLGDSGSNKNRSTPTQIGTTSDWSIIAAGNYHTIACKTNNTIWSWGKNDSGQLGLSDTNNRNTPSQIGNDSNWSAIAAGWDHAIALKSNATIWVWGDNWSGQLGLGNSGTGTDRNTPTAIGTGSDWSNISAGDNHTIGIKTNRTIWSWGQNFYGQLGLGYTSMDSVNTPAQIGTNSNWFTIAGGYRANFAIMIDGTLWSCGDNFYGQLGLGDNTTRNSPAQIGADSDWLAIVSKGANAIARRTNGTLWTWGSNDMGRLGLGDNVNRNIPTLVGE